MNFHYLEERVAELIDACRRKDDRIRELEDMLRRRDAAINDLEDHLRRRDADLRELQAICLRRDETIHKNCTMLDKLEAECKSQADTMGHMHRTILELERAVDDAERKGAIFENMLQLQYNCAAQTQRNMGLVAEAAERTITALETNLRDIDHVCFVMHMMNDMWKRYTNRLNRILEGLDWVVKNTIHAVRIKYEPHKTEELIRYVLALHEAYENGEWTHK